MCALAITGVGGNSGIVQRVEERVISQHNLTSYTSNSPFVVSASSELTGHRAWAAFDGNRKDSISSGWVSNFESAPNWLQCDFGIPKTVTKIGIVGRDAGGAEPQNIRDFQVRTSLDGVTFTSQLFIAGFTSWVALQESFFTLPNPTTARYIRIFATASVGGITHHRAIQELYVYGFH